MHLDDAASELLKTWITSKLEKISDADSDVLADYVLALAKTDEPERVARANCIENLNDFLHAHTEPFVNELFQAIATKSYDPNRPPLKPSAGVYQPLKRTSVEPPRAPNESRKRSQWHDWDREDGAGGIGRLQPWDGDGRPIKQPRRGGRGFDGRGGRQSYAHAPSFGLPQGLPPPPTLPGLPPIDPANPMAALLAMQQTISTLLTGMSGADLSNNGQGFAQFTNPQRCLDYDTKGFCAAGASCPYDHSNAMSTSVPSDLAYDPNQATLLNVEPSRKGRFDTSRSERGRGGRGRGPDRDSRRSGVKRADFSHAGPNRDLTATSIVVEQIPEEHCNEADIRAFFEKFGSILEVDLRVDRALAIVKYEDHDAAQAAYDSPNVVFDNRFVKVYWYKPEKLRSVLNGKAMSAAVNGNSEDVDMTEEEHVDVEEIARRQAEAQAKYDEAKKMREEAARQRFDISAKLQDMEAHRASLAAQLAKKANKSSGEETLQVSPTLEETEQSQALKLQLAQLEAEAKSLGIDPDAPSINGFSDYPSYRGRGGWRGRSRGRGRVYFNSSRGGWARSGNRGGAVMRLDNRPKTVALTFQSGTYDDHDEAIRQFLLFNNLDSAVLTRHPDRDNCALVAFNERYEGENLMAAMSSELPHIGKVGLSWYKADEPITTTNGTHVAAAEERVVIDGSPEPGTSDLPEAEPVLDTAEEDFDRFG